MINTKFKDVIAAHCMREEFTYMQSVLEKIPYERASKKKNAKMKWPFEADYGVSTDLTREHEMEVDEALEKKNWMKWVSPEESIAP